MHNLIVFITALAAVTAQRLTESSTDATDGQRRSAGGGYGLLRPNYGGSYGSPGYGGFGSNGGGYGGYNGGYGGNYGGYPGGYPSQPYPGYGGGAGYGGYPIGYGGYPGYSPVGGGGFSSGYPGYGGYRPNYRPGYDYRPGYNYPGTGFNRPSYTPYRPGYDRPNNPGSNFGGYDGYSDNIRFLGRKVGETKKEEEA